MNIHAPYISPELEQAAASTRTESEVRAQLLKECDQIVRDTLAEPDESFAILGRNPTLADAHALEQEKTATRAQSAFLTVVKTASEMTTVGLPEGKTVAEALERATARKEFLWRQDMDEEERIAALLRYCTSLYQGNETAGQLLASAALWR